jgi:hypothetical protein
MALLKMDGASAELSLEVLGSVAAASSVSYLDEGVVFVGSHMGDSQVSAARCACFFDVSCKNVCSSL